MLSRADTKAMIDLMLKKDTQLMGIVLGIPLRDVEDYMAHSQNTGGVRYALEGMIDLPSYASRSKSPVVVEESVPQQNITTGLSIEVTTKAGKRYVFTKDAYCIPTNAGVKSDGERSFVVLFGYKHANAKVYNDIEIARSPPIGKEEARSFSVAQIYDQAEEGLKAYLYITQGVKRFDEVQAGLKSLERAKPTVRPSIQSIHTAEPTAADSGAAIESRQAQTVEALAAADGRGVPIRTLVVVEGVSDKELKDLEEGLNEGLYGNGFGSNQPGSRRGKTTHELLLVSGRKDYENEVEFEKRLEHEIDMARGYLPDDVRNRDRIVTVFAPMNVVDHIRSYASEKHGDTVNIINDAYSDSSVDKSDKLYPDAMIRYAIARQIFASTISESLREGALETINNLLQKITEDGITIDTIETLFAIDFILRIKPVNWNEEIGKWRVSQEAVATAL